MNFMIKSNTWTLDSLAIFEHDSSLPIFFRSILLDLIPGSVINKSYLSPQYCKNIELFIYFWMSLNIWKCHSHWLYPMLCLEFCFNKFLINNISFAIFNYKKYPRISFISKLFINLIFLGWIFIIYTFYI